MAHALANGFLALFFVAAPALLVARHLWPSRLPWIAVIAGVAIISWASLVFAEHFSLVRESECEAQIVGDTLVGCPIYERWYTYNREVGWLKGLIYLMPWLALYAVVGIIRRRRNRVIGSLSNTSLERTRDR